MKRHEIELKQPCESAVRVLEAEMGRKVTLSELLMVLTVIQAVLIHERDAEQRLWRDIQDA